VENLDRLNTSINTTDAGRSRLFLEGQTKAAIEGAAMRGKAQGA
jgi:hypothetical protein